MVRDMRRDIANWLESLTPEEKKAYYKERERRKQQALEPETYAKTLRKRVQQYMKRK